jgi:hypothetical protein
MISKKEKLFISKLLDLAADSFDNHICNDLDRDLEAHFSLEEWKELSLKFHQWNEHTLTPKESYLMQHDSALMSYFSNLLKKEANEEE